MPERCLCRSQRLCHDGQRKVVERKSLYHAVLGKCELEFSSLMWLLLVNGLLMAAGSHCHLQRLLFLPRFGKIWNKLLAGRGIRRWLRDLVHKSNLVYIYLVLGAAARSGCEQKAGVVSFHDTRGESCIPLTPRKTRHWTQ